MKYFVVSVRDRAADVFAVPNFVNSIGGAIRSFGDAINSKQADSALCLHPEDFDMYELGSFDDATGSYEALPQVRQIAIGKDLVRKE